MSSDRTRQIETMNRLVAYARRKRVSVHIDEQVFTLRDALTGDELGQVDRSAYDRGLTMLEDKLNQIDDARPVDSSATMLAAVREHAKTHYDDGGWSVVTEVMSDADILEVIVEENARTCADAIAAIGSDARLDAIDQMFARAGQEW